MSERDPWTDHAACADMPKAVFFDGRKAAAKRACSTCPVRVRCLTEAYERGERSGVWGGVDFGLGGHRGLLQDRRARLERLVGRAGGAA